MQDPQWSNMFVAVVTVDEVNLSYCEANYICSYICYFPLNLQSIILVFTLNKLTCVSIHQSPPPLLQIINHLHEQSSTVYGTSHLCWSNYSQKVEP